MQKIQYTIRQVPPSLNRALREKARQQKSSLNQLVLKLLAQAAGLAEPIQYHDLDPLAGTWKEDPRFDEAIAAQDQIDLKLWK